MRLSALIDSVGGWPQDRCPMTGELETRVLRKISWRIVPFVMLLYFIAFVDRVNVGFVALTMNKDLGLSASVYGFGAGISRVVTRLERLHLLRAAPANSSLRRPAMRH